MASACFSSVNSSIATTTKATSAAAMTIACSPARVEGILSCSSCSVGSRRPCHRLQYMSSPVEYRSLPSSPYHHFSLRSKLVRASAVPVSEDTLTEQEEIQDSLDKNGESNEDGEAPGEEAAENAFPEGPKLYVGNLPWDFTSQEVAELFQKVAGVDMVEVMYDRGTGRSRGFGFVTMSSMEDANTAIEKLDGTDCAGRAIRVNFPIKNRESSPSSSSPSRFGTSNANKLFVGNLAWTMDTAKLEEAFSEHGQVIDARVLVDRESGRSRGFGFVTMASESDMNEALSKMNGAELEGRNVRVSLAGERPSA